nr:reverse transcriptase domain-containing protein [Tanacetum cinerariifolium]
MFLGKYFPPSMVTKLRNEITNFRQRPDESLFEAWERYKLSIDRCPNRNMLPVTQIDAFYNGLTLRHRDTINAVVGGTFMKRRLEECYDLIENMTTHHNDWDTSAQRSELSSSITSFDTKISTLKAEMAEINKKLMRVLQVNQQVKAVTPNCVTCGGPHSFNDCPVTFGNTQNEELKSITTRSGTAYQGLTTPITSSSLPPVVERKTEATKDTVHPTNNGSTKDVQPSVVQTESPILNSELVVAHIIKPVVSPVSAPKPNQIPSISKLRDPGEFLISCDFLGMAECFAMADLDAIINLMPLSVWNKLSLPDLSPTCMTIELTDRLISHPLGVAKDVFVKVGTFHFLADFVVVDFDADPRVPLILERSFLKTGRALIDVFEGELTLRVGKEAITFNLDQTSRYSANYNDMTANRIDFIDMACEDYSDFLLEEVDAFLALEDDLTSPEVNQSYVDTEGDILLLEAFLNDDPSLPPLNQGNYMPQVRKELKICEAKSDKSSNDEPPEVELKDLPPHLEYVILEGDDKLPVIIAKNLSVEEKTALIRVLKSHKRAIAWKLFDIKERMLKRCEDTNLCLNWEKSHFIVKEGIVLGHKISKNRSKVDKAKVNVITKLPHPKTVKGIRSFLDHVGFYRRFIKDFSKISRPMTHLLEKDTPFFFSKECVEAFQTLKRKLTEALILIAPDWDLPFELMCNASDFAIATPYHPQTSGQVEVLNRGLKRILKRTVGENRTSWSDKLDDALWAFQTTYKIPIGCILYKLVYGKACHLPIELEHKAYWALKHENFDLQTASDHKKFQLNELRDQSYENSLIFKEKTKRLHDSKIKDRVFNIDDGVFLFNSRLKIFSAKLKTRWSGPFTISHVFSYGIVELSQPDGPNFKVNGHRLKHYFGEDIPKMVILDL